MGIRVVIPYHLRQFTDGSDIAELAASDIGECLCNLGSQFPGLKGQFIDSEGRLHPFINIYINGEDIRWAQGLATHVEDGDEIWIVPLFAGG